MNIQIFNPDNGIRLGEHQMINHFPNHYELTRKDLMVKNLKRYKKVMKSHHIPLTSHHPILNPHTTQHTPDTTQFIPHTTQFTLNTALKSHHPPLNCHDPEVEKEPWSVSIVMTRRWRRNLGRCLLS
jgi:hypothetical protein